MKNVQLTTSAKLGLFIYSLIVGFLIADIIYLQNIKSSCERLEKEGYVDIRSDSPKYQKVLDRDDNGIACER